MRTMRGLKLASLLGFTAILVGCGGTSASAGSSGAASPASAAAAAAPSGWDGVVAAAKSEGSVVIYAQPGTTYRQAVVGAFEKAYPDIKADAVFALPAERLSRITLERQAGRYLADVWVGGTTDAVTTLKEAKVVAPLTPDLALPEVTDANNWFQHKLWWADSAEPYTTLMFVGDVQGVVFVNTNMVDPSQFKSYMDILDPKWKGKIASTDVRNTGTGAAPARFVFHNQDLGANWFKRLFSEQNVQLSNDQAQLVNWVAQGTYPIGLFLSPAEVAVATKQGLPVKMVPAEQFKEGASIGPANGAVDLIDKAPHPNAAKVYINWLLSKDGQSAWQREIADNSLRSDIPKDGLNPQLVPKPDGNYVNSGTEEFSRAFGPATIRAPIDEGLKAAGQSG
jgi:iron(III) transport system substrate-binding protein